MGQWRKPVSRTAGSGEISGSKRSYCGFEKVPTGPFLYLYEIKIVIIYTMITILATGKVRERYIKEGMEEYLTRLQKYAKVVYVEKESLNVPDGFVIALDEKGKQFTSEQFAGYLKKKTLEEKNIRFIIGGAEGIPSEVKLKCQETIALSEMTFPNQLVRLIFVEQLYRAFTIMKGENYHK